MDAACLLYVRLVCVGFLYPQGTNFSFEFTNRLGVVEKCRYYKGSTMEVLSSVDCTQEIFALGYLTKDPQN